MRAHRMRAVAGLSPVLTFGAGSRNDNPETTQSFSNFSIGTAHPSRYVVVFMIVRTATNISVSPTVTVGGQAASEVVANWAPPATTYSAIHITNSPVTSGTEADILVTAGGATINRIIISTYSLVTRGYAPRLFQSLDNGDVSGNPVTLTSGKTTQAVGITGSWGGTSSSISALAVSGPVTSNYNSGVTGFNVAASATVTGPGSVVWSATGTGAVTRPVLALWY